MKLKYFEWYVQHVWPVQRRLVKGLSRRCRSCIVSEKYTPLDDQGICKYCLDSKKKGSSDEPVTAPSDSDLVDRFNQTIGGCAGAGDKYDALLLLSGGKDSAYILNRMSTLHPEVRLLCATVDNGFMSPVAIPNAMHAADRLNTDLIVIRSNRELFRQELRKAFLNIQGQDAYKVVDYTDGSLIFETGKTTANDLGIPAMIAGLSWVQMQMIAGVDSFEIREEGQPLLICPLAAWRTDEQEIRTQVRDLSLMLPGTDSPLASNSDLVTPMCVVDMLNLGYSSFEPEFAQLVREKKTDRRLWRNIFELMEHGVKTGRLIKEANRTLGRLELTLSEVIGREV